MTIEQAKAIAIQEFLKLAGYTSMKTTPKDIRFLSPFRHEKTPSFHVTRDGKAWKDFGDGRGGNIIDLAYRMASGHSLPHQLDSEQVKMALTYIETVVGSNYTVSRSIRPPSQPEPKTHAYRILEAKPFSVYGRGSYLAKAALYLGSRGINAERFAPYLEDIVYTAEDGKRRFAFGMQNVAGGREARRYGDWAKLAIGHKDITIFKATKQAAPWHCFYSLIDMGTFLTVDKPPVGAYHYLIINSDSLVEKAIHYLDSLLPGYMMHYPHQDESGQKAYQKMLQFLSNKKWGVGERTHLYTGYKDWTEAREKQLGLGAGKLK